MTSTEDPEKSADSDPQTGPAVVSPETVKPSTARKATPRRSSSAGKKAVTGKSSRGISADAFQSGHRVWPD